MSLHPTPVPRAEAVWERRQEDPIGSFLSGFFGPGNTDSIVSSATFPTTSSTPTTSSSSIRTTSSSRSTSNGLPTPVASTPTTTSTSSSTTSSRSSTPTSTTSSTSASSTVITTSSPSTLVTTSNFVSGTSTSQVVITTVVTPVVTTTAAPGRSNSNRSSSNGALIGGVVGGVVGGLALLALIITICIMASRRRSRTGHAYFLCFGERPSRAAKGDLGHSGGAWPTFDPKDDYGGPGFAAGAAGAGAAAGAAAGSRNRRRRREQTNATLQAQFANEDDPESYAYSGSNAHGTHGAYGGNGGNYDGYDAYNAYGASGHPNMQEHGRGAAGALAAGAAAGGAGAYLYNNASPSNGHQRRSSAGHPSYGTAQDAYTTGNMSPHATTSNENVPAPWTLPMMGWQDTHGPYSVAGVGQNMAGAPPQARFMVSPSEANVAAAAAAANASPARSPGPDYSHFDPPEVRDARAREAAAAALARGSFSTSHSHNNSIPTGPTSPRRQSRRLSSNHGSPVNDNIGLVGGLAPPAYVDAQDDMEEVADQPRRLHLTNAEPDNTDDDSSRGGPSRRYNHNHKDAPPAATYRQN
ncbi:uncharacterized protein PSANT_04999 [Moesziomyces antarcticus]|uniref:Uncharacterized protein n=2 Tax=Pseudozyma antarctica TaxID=84753 RepID=A0A5C3FUQ8_PSEA2|nr:uncharacterized protein PSANT_04999 [Moesziomyces antarcticus]